MQEVERVASVSPGSELNMSGILMQEESFESDEEDAREVEVVDTDTDGDEMSLQEAIESLRSLVASLAMRECQTAEFYSQLVVALTALPVQYLDSDHAVISMCIQLVPHVVLGISNPETRAWACVPFSLIIRNRAIVHELLRTQQAISALVQAIQQVKQENLRVVLLSSVRMLSASRGCRSELVRCGCNEMLIQVISDPESGELSKAHVVFALRRICKTTRSRELLAKLHGVEPLLDYFFKLRSQQVQKSLAGLLQTLATNPDCKVQVAELGAIPRLVSLLNVSQMHMLKYVICIIRNLACNNDENRLLIARSGGIRILLNLMPLVSVKLQQKIAGALQNLATNRDNRALISECGGVSVLIALIKTRDQKLQKYGLGGLKRLVYNSRESTLDFQKQGGLPALIALLDSDDVSVLKNAVHALNRVRHYIGREPIEELGGLAAMGRLLTCPHEKIRVLARRNLQSMDEDLPDWLRRIEQIALELLRAARVLLLPHRLIHPSDAAEAERARAAGGASGGDTASSSSMSSSSGAVESLGRRRMSVSALRKTLRGSRDPQRRAESEPDVMSRSAGAMASSVVVTPPPSLVTSQEENTQDLSASLDHLHGMTPEVNRVLVALGYGETYWNLRAGSPHFLPIPLLEIILSMLDVDLLLSSSQKRAIFAWARDRSTLGRSMHEFLTSITNNAVTMAAPPPAPEIERRGSGCIIA